MTFLEYISLYNDCIICNSPIQTYLSLNSKHKYTDFPGSISYNLENNSSLRFEKGGLTCGNHYAFDKLQKEYNSLPQELFVTTDNAITWINNINLSHFTSITFHSQCSNDSGHLHIESKNISDFHQPFSVQLRSEKVYFDVYIISFYHDFKWFRVSAPEKIYEIPFVPLKTLPFSSVEKFKSRLNAITLLKEK